MFLGDNSSSKYEYCFVGVPAYSFNSSAHSALRLILGDVKKRIEGKSKAVQIFSNFHPLDLTIVERLKQIYPDCEIKHIHNLPCFLHSNPQVRPLYLTLNTEESSLLSFYNSSYPGITIALDASMFFSELGPLFFSTDPKGVNKKIEEFYPEAKVDLGKQKVLGRSMEVYSKFYPCLSSLKNRLAVLTLENRMERELAREIENLECIPLDNYFKRGEKRYFESSGISKILIIVGSPFAISSKEIRIISGEKSYRKINYPMYYMLEYEQESSKIISLEEISNVCTLDFTSKVDGCIITDLPSTKGIPAGLYEALCAGCKISVPKSLSSIIENRHGVSIHERSAELLIILESLRDIESADVLSVDSNYTKKFFLRVENIFDKCSLSLEAMKNKRKDSLRFKLDKICINSFDGALERKFLKEAQELFDYEAN